MPSQSFRVVYDLNSGGLIATVSTDWDVYAKKHVHGAQPNGNDVTAAKSELRGLVKARCEKAKVPYPGDAAVDVGARVETKSSH